MTTDYIAKHNLKYHSLHTICEALLARHCFVQFKQSVVNLSNISLKRPVDPLKHLYRMKRVRVFAVEILISWRRVSCWGHALFETSVCILYTAPQRQTVGTTSSSPSLCGPSMLATARSSSVLLSCVSQRAHRKPCASGPCALRGGDKQSDVELVKAARAYSEGTRVRAGDR